MAPSYFGIMLKIDRTEGALANAVKFSIKRSEERL